MRLTHHQCNHCKVPHRACNMVSEIMTQTPGKAGWRSHNIFLLPALNNSHSDQALQTCCYQAPVFGTLSRTCPPSKQEEKVHLVTVGMQELSWASLQARRSQGPGSESLQRARLPDQSVCTWEGQASMDRFSLWEYKQLAVWLKCIGLAVFNYHVLQQSKYWWSCNIDERTRSSMNLATNFNISSSVRAPSYLFVPSLT